MLLCLSSNHQNASFEVLEKLSFTAPEATSGLVASSDFVSGVVVLATCNRFEAYLDIDEPLTAASAVAVESTLGAISESSGIPVAQLRASIAVHEGADVPAHLFAVTSGLESVVVGEDEISGQVATALSRARRDGTTSRDLERLFQKASNTSRGVKNQTALGGAGRSLVRLALELASSRVPDWAEARVLVIGTGKYAATTVAALRDRGARDIRIFSRTGRGPAFAAKHGLVHDHDFDVDVIVACTANTVIGAELFVGEGRRIVVDLGLPRNIDPAVASVPGVELLDLETVRLHAPLEELSEQAHAMVRDAARAFAAETEAEPAIVALRTHVFGLLEAEIARARARGAGDETEAALRHLAGVLLHGPSVRARELAQEGRVDEFVTALGAIYGIAPAERAADTDLGVESA